jgi:adenosine/AMP kinase
LEINKIKIEPSKDTQIIVAQSHFIKTVEDVYECLMNCVPNIKFGIAFCEASGQCLVGHSLVILIKNAFPINVLSMLRAVPEIVNIYCATANPIEILYIETDQGRAIIGIVDGYKPKGIEDEDNIRERKTFLREIGYKR